MSAKKTGPGTMEDWQAMQQQWWSSVLEGAKQFEAPKMPDGAAAMKGFGDLFGPAMGGNNQATMDRFMAGSKQFLQWVESLSAQITARGGTPDQITDWTALFKQSAGPMFEGNNPFLHLFQSLSGDGARGFEQFSAALGNPAEAFKGEMKKTLAMPAFGFQREQQERLQQSALAQMEYQEAMAAYNAQMLAASKLSFEKLQLKLAEREEPGRQLTSLRAVYDVWIDAAEEAYAEIALSADFRTAYGNLVNKQMRLRQSVQGEIERQSAQVGMPTRTEINAVHQKLQSMRRRIRELEDLVAEIGATPAQSEDKKSSVRAKSESKSKPASKPASKAASKPKAKAPRSAAVKATVQPTAKKTASRKKSANAPKASVVVSKQKARKPVAKKRRSLDHLA